MQSPSDGAVLVLANDFPDSRDERPVGIFIKEQVRAFARTGLRQTVVVPYPAGLERYRKTSYHDYRTPEGVPARFLQYTNPIFPLHWHVCRSRWVRVEALAVVAFLRERDMQPGLIHAHYTWPTGAVGAEVARHFNVPLVITEHAHTTIDRLIDRRDRILTGAWTAADAIVRVSSADVERFQAIAGPGKVHVIYNGHDETLMRPMDRTTVRTALGLPHKRRLLFSLGGLYPYKGHRFLIESIRRIAGHLPDVDLLIGGAGPLRKSLERQVETSGLQGRIRLLGNLAHGQVPLWMAACDLFVLPSVVESFGIVQVEALACGRPVIATYNRASQNVITADSLGILCPPEEPQALASAIVEALGRSWVEDELTAHARRFSWAANVTAYRALYETLLTKRPVH